MGKCMRSEIREAGRRKDIQKTSGEQRKNFQRKATEGRNTGRRTTAVVRRVIGIESSENQTEDISDGNWRAKAGKLETSRSRGPRSLISCSPYLFGGHARTALARFGPHRTRPGARSGWIGAREKGKPVRMRASNRGEGRDWFLGRKPVIGSL